MANPGTIRFAELSVTPSPPPVGYCLIYVKTDNIAYIEDSSGNEVPIGANVAITSLTGEATATGPGAAVVTLSNSAVIGKVLTGFTAGPNSPVLATDTILQAFQKLQAQSTSTSGSAITSLTGDVTATGPGAAAATISANVVTNAKLAQAPANTLKGNNTGGTANETDLTVAQVNTMLGTVTNVTGSGNIASSGGATPNITFTGVLPIANGGTNSSAALNNNRIIVSSGSAIVEAAALTNGQLLIGSTGAAPVAAAITAGSGILITNAAGSITVATNSITATTTKTANYTILTTDSTIFCDTSGGAFTLTLPSPTSIAGKIFRIIDITGFFQTNNLTLARSSTEKIEGLAASKILQTAWGWFQITTDGTDWFVG